MQYASPVRAKTQEIDLGLREYMLGIYSFMTAGLGITFLTSFGVSYIPGLFAVLMAGPQAFIFMLAPMIMVMIMSFGLERLSPSTLRIMFFAYSGLIGISLSTIFYTFTTVSIVSTLLITTIAYAALSIYALTTTKNLSGMGTFLIMGLVGAIVAMIVNIFLASSVLAFAINIVGVLIFAGLTAYDTQRLQQMYVSGETNTKLSIMGALSLYLNFVNLFMFLLQILGNRQE